MERGQGKPSPYEMCILFVKKTRNYDLVLQSSQRKEADKSCGSTREATVARTSAIRKAFLRGLCASPETSKFPALWTRPPAGWHSVVNLFLAVREGFLTAKSD